MKLWIVLSTALIVYFSYGFYISQSDVAIISQTLQKDDPNGFYDYRGAINIHSKQSIGSGSIPQIQSAGKLSGLDFLMLTDLNHFETGNTIDFNRGSPLFFQGNKVSYLDSRFIFYSPNGSSLGTNLGEAQVNLADMLSQDVGNNNNKLIVLAHPFKAGFSWQGEFPSGADGFELLNMKSLFQRSWDNSKLSTLWSLITYPFNPRLAFLRLFSEPQDELQLLDHVAQTRRVIIYAGAEASARTIPWAGYLVKFPSYQRSFEFVTNHVLLRSELTGNINQDKSKIFQALKDGQFYLSIDLLGDPKGFNAWVEEKGKIFLMGSKISMSKGMSLRVNLPQKPNCFFEIVIYKNGERQKSYNDIHVQHHIAEPGVYRVQVRVSPYLPLPDAKRWLPWIYTNSFFIR